MGKPANRTYMLDAGLQEQLEAAIDTMLTSHVDAWKEHVKLGIINEEERAVFAAMGWLSSRNDSRLTPSKGPTEDDA
jgi:hypothetical protein